jgi:putative ABC transport system ATP-binding protein
VLRTEPWAVQCEELVKVYRTPSSAVSALRGVTAQFPQGGISAIAGPSGSGKSSLLRLIGAMDRPTEGALMVGGVPVHSASSRTLRRLRRRTVGIVFQRPSDNFFPYLTVGEHLQVAAHASRGPGPMHPSEFLDALGIGHRAGHLPSELSGGEQARAAVAHVLARGASIVVADEPTAELDSDSARRLIEALHRLVELGVTFIVATHDPAVIRAAHQVVELDYGQLKRRHRSTPVGTLPRGPLQPAPRFHQAEHSRPEPAILRVRAVSKSYRHGTEVIEAVRDASFALSSRELVGLVGRSGSGKTTLLNLIAGWEDPDRGNVEIGGKDATRVRFSWSEVAVLPQKLGLMDELTVRENVEYPALLAHALESVKPLIDQLLNSLGLAGLQNRYPRETSFGEQQRTALARALVLSPGLVLADEPSAHQDSGWMEAVFSTLRQAAEVGTACLTATHDEGIRLYLDRTLSMADGVLTEATA